MSEATRLPSTYPFLWIQEDIGVEELVTIIVLSFPVLHQLVQIWSITYKSCGDKAMSKMNHRTFNSAAEGNALRVSYRITVSVLLPRKYLISVLIYTWTHVSQSPCNKAKTASRSLLYPIIWDRILQVQHKNVPTPLSCAKGVSQ